MSRHYIVAMKREMSWSRPGQVSPSTKELYVGKLYTLQEARKRVEELNETCKPELKYLGFDEFIVYSVSRDRL